ncbi:hypothetical protein E2C01_038745 [Portunus trituberculatus]|uniref:Uncharacterized protein n=1 Tax=Portunus trituberculatus TaxID=210409 RepID=A0A5B7FBL6_PORTR|nr:hypothetical protein [Portunus trituberculatus]
MPLCLARRLGGTLSVRDERKVPGKMGRASRHFIFVHLFVLALHVLAIAVLIQQEGRTVSHDNNAPPCPHP